VYPAAGDRPAREAPREYPIVIKARKAARTAKMGTDLAIACDQIADFYGTSKPEHMQRIRQAIERSLGELRSPEWAYLSSSNVDHSVYSGILHEHMVVSVSVGQGSPAFQRSMSTLVKAVFQQTVLADLSGRIAKE